MALPSNLNSFLSAPLAQAWPPNVQWTKRPERRDDVYDSKTGLIIGAVCFGEIVEVTDGEKTLTLDVSSCALCQACGGRGFTIDYSSCAVSACKECAPEVIATEISQGAYMAKPWVEKYEQAPAENFRIDIDTAKKPDLIPLQTARKYREE